MIILVDLLENPSIIVFYIIDGYFDVVYLTHF